MKKIIYNVSLLIIMTLTISLVSCKKEIYIDLHPSDPQIVIEGRVPMDSLVSVQITKSKNFDEDNSYPAVVGAIVSISDNAGNSEVLQQAPSGLYVSQTLRGIEGHTYNMKVEVEGKTYTATSTIPTAVMIDSIGMYRIPAFTAEYPIVFLKDPAGEANYYRYKFAINRNVIKTISVTNDDTRDGHEISQILAFDKDTENGGKDIQQGDTIDVELQSIDKGVYDFFYSLSRIDQNLTNPTSNIQGGALGYFSAYASDRQRMIASWTK